MNVARKLIRDHLVEGEMTPGEPIAISIDQTLTQDATGTLVMLTLEAFGLDRAKVELAAQYVDHNLIQEDSRNPDDHLFLESACRRFGIWYSRPGNGVSHPVHMQRFGKPGKTLLGADSHSCAAGALGMLAIGAGGAEVAAAIAGEPFRMRMPEIFGVELTGTLPDWVSAKDVILEMLRRHGVDGGVGRIIEYHGPGVASLSAMDRHVIANMGAELGATTTVFPSDDEVRRFLTEEDRGEDWIEILADDDARYDVTDTISLSDLEPLIAKPTSPDNVVPVREIAGKEIYQAYIGSSANPGYRDFAVPAEIVKGKSVAPGVSFDVNPTSRQLLQTLVRDGHLLSLIGAGGRIHQAGCNGCIGMGQAPASGRNSLRTVPRNFPGRSGASEDSVFLCSPETAAASALFGVITDPRDLDMDYPRIDSPKPPLMHDDLLVPPAETRSDDRAALVKGPNIAELPEFDPLPERLELPVLLKAGDDVSTDEIMPAGARVLPYRSNIPRIARFCFEGVDPEYISRVDGLGEESDHAVVAGSNYGQGSSREHAALAPRYLGLRAVLCRSFARIHRDNLVNYGVLPISFAEENGYEKLDRDDVVVLEDLLDLSPGDEFTARTRDDAEIRVRIDISETQMEILKAGGLVDWIRERG